jgi:hypothetical protein
MPKFSFTGVDENGEEVNGFVDEPTEQAAIASIREAGYYPTKVEAVELDEPTEAVQAEPNEGTAAWSQPPATPKPTFAKKSLEQTKLAKIDQLPPYNTPFIAGLHIFAGVCSTLAFLVLLLLVFVHTDSSSEKQQQEALMWCVWTALLALLNFGLAQIIEIIAKGAYATRQQVILMRQLVRANNETPEV